MNDQQDNTITNDVPPFQLADLFEVVADAVPDRLALVAGDRRLTYRDLDDRATRFANHLTDLGLRRGAKVAIYAWNRAEWLEAMIGAFKASMVPININYRYVADELAYVLDNADVEVLVFERAFAPIVGELRDRLPLLRHTIVLDDATSHDAGEAEKYEVALASASHRRDPSGRSTDDLYVLYTGGTTGMPKGVMWRHEDIFFAAMGGNGFGQGPVETVSDVAARILPDEYRIQALILPPLMHGAAQWVAFIALFGGGLVTLWTDHTMNATEVWRLVEKERCNYITLVGDAMARPLAEALDDPGFDVDTSSIGIIGSGGAIFSATVKEQLRAHLPEVRIVDGFGSSEIGAGGQQSEITAQPRFPLNEWTTVLDEELRPVTPGSGVVGRFARRGHIPLGYAKDEEKTTATFPTDADGVRWAVPGDHATIDDDGMITLLGRGSGCINSGGEKIYPEEVEAALKSHPDVFDVIVVGAPDERFTQRVAAIVQPRPGSDPTLEDLANHCRATIAGYKVPRQLTIVDVIARTPSGKPDYRWASDLVTAG